MTHLLRFVRILASVLVCYVAFSVAAGYLSNSEGLHGPTYYIAGSFFLLAFTSFYSVPILLAVCGALWVMDRLKLGKPWHSILFWSALGIVLWHKTWITLLVSALAGLLYWILAGRLAGSPGFTWQSIKRGGVVPKVITGMTALYVAFVLMSWTAYGAKMAWVSAFPPDPGSPPFTVQFERQMTVRMQVAMMDFPDAESCVASDAGPVVAGKLVLIDWNRIDNSYAAQVCLFRLLAEYGGAGNASDWLKGQGFNVNDASFSSRNPYIDRDGVLNIHGTWSNRADGPLYRDDNLLVRIMGSVVHGTGIHSGWSPDGKTLLWVNLSSTTL